MPSQNLSSDVQWGLYHLYLLTCAPMRDVDIILMRGRAMSAYVPRNIVLARGCWDPNPSLVDTVNNRPCDEQVTINANLDAESKSLKRFTVAGYENL